jgi:ABC-2 type transport system ATP-binding protein
MLELRAVTKRYTGIPAVENVSFVARAGEVTGYLGPNGSGKSTTMKMITGLIEPSDGDILFRGRPVDGDPMAYRQILGYVPEEPHLYPHLTGAEYLEMVGQLRGLPRRQLTKKIDGFLRLLSLHQDRYVAISSYSKGMRQKVLLIAALLHNPELVLLDEPFSGLDVNSALVLRYTGKRTRELGIRAALGASPAQASWCIMKEGLRLTALGLGIGLGIYGIAGRAFAHLLFGVPPRTRSPGWQ